MIHSFIYAVPPEDGHNACGVDMRYSMVSEEQNRTQHNRTGTSVTVYWLRVPPEQAGRRTARTSLVSVGTPAGP